MRSLITGVFLLLILISSTSLGQEITIEKIWKNYEFYAKGVDGFKSMKDGEYYTKPSEDLSIRKYKISDPNDKGSILVDGTLLHFKGKQLQYDDYEFNSDETKILFMCDVESIYRRSYAASYYLYDIASKKLSALDEEHTPQTLAEYSPDGKLVSYIHGNDLFVKNVVTGEIKKLTQDGKKNKIINGTTDWVYEEEFSITKGYGWSPDSKTIAFLKFNEKEVKEFSLSFYGSLYPENYKYKYPKAGEDNSVVTAHYVNVKSGKISKLDLGKYEYIPRINWSSTENKLILQTLNRHQNHLKYHLVDFSLKKPSTTVFFEEKSNSYVEIDDNLILLKDGKSLIRTSESSGFNQIYKVGFDGKSQQLTSGNWDVMEFLGLDEETESIFYSAASNGPLNKIIYKLNLKTGASARLTDESGWSDAEFTNGFKYFVHSYSTANTPTTHVLRNAKGELVAELEVNQELEEKLSGYKLSPKEFIKINANGVELNASIIKPHNFDATKKYPVYVTVYGGPGSNEVKNAWDGNDYMYHQLLAQKGYIVFSVDPRGTMYRGAEFKKCTYLQLGKLEIEDVLNSCKELQKLPYVDATRFGIMGWSYGGYMSSLGITKGADVFKMAIAVAPVTNWRYYDNIYTERFMHTPQENQNGYDLNSPINYVQQMKGKYLLIHGSADDNVHYQNALEMVNALVKANKQFDMFIYPNRNHGIYGGNTRNHLFQMMLDYIVLNL
ncbi:MAG: S9 family peptidase [Crocinitomicaceae bacterium]